MVIVLIFDLYIAGNLGAVGRGWLDLAIIDKIEL